MKKIEQFNSDYGRRSENALTTVLTCDVYDDDAHAHLEWPITHHARHRAIQRGYSWEQLTMVMEYGSAFFKQGHTFYVATEKCLPSWLDHQTRRKLNNTVVLVKDGVVITCYKSDNALKHIKRKQKRISRRSTLINNAA